MDGDKGYDEKLRRSYRHQTNFSTTKLYDAMEAGEIVTEKLRDGSGSWSTFLSRRMLKPVSVAFTAALLLRLDLELHLSEVDIAATRHRCVKAVASR